LGHKLNGLPHGIAHLVLVCKFEARPAVEFHVGVWTSDYRKINFELMKMKTDNTRVYKILFSSVYPLYIEKAGKKGRTKDEVDSILLWLTGYTKKSLQQQIDKKVDLQAFFDQAPQINPNVSKITGVICGYRVEDIEDKLMQKIRYMDKLIDELAKGKPMEKILRK
jgi:hypothetical protein